MNQPTPIEVTHLSVCLSVKSIEESAAWYQRVFGFEIIRQQSYPRPVPDVAFMKVNGVIIELVEIPDFQEGVRPQLPASLTRQEVSQLSFRIQDIEKVKAAAEAHGVGHCGQ